MRKRGGKIHNVSIEGVVYQSAIAYGDWSESKGVLRDLDIEFQDADGLAHLFESLEQEGPCVVIVGSYPTKKNRAGEVHTGAMTVVGEKIVRMNATKPGGTMRLTLTAGEMLKRVR